MLHIYLNLPINLKNYLVPWLLHYLSFATLLCFKYLLNQSSTFQNPLTLQLPRTVLKGNCPCPNRLPFPLPQFIVLGVHGVCGHGDEVVRLSVERIRDGWNLLLSFISSLSMRFLLGGISLLLKLGVDNGEKRPENTKSINSNILYFYKIEGNIYPLKGSDVKKKL